MWSDGRPIYRKAPKKRGAADEAFYRRWAEGHSWCMFCGVPATEAPWPGLSSHHLIGGQGRSHEAANLLRVCDRCHRLAEGHRIVVEGVDWPVMPLAVCLSVKRCRDVEAFDEARLRQLRGSNLPQMEAVPDIVEREFRRRRPWDVARFAKLETDVDEK